MGEVKCCGGCPTNTLPTIDRLTITEIRCHKPASGMDSSAMAAFAAFGGAVATVAQVAVATAGTVASGGVAAPVTFAMIATAAGTGGAVGSAALKALNVINDKFSGADDLIVMVGGRKVVSTNPAAKFQSLDADQSIYNLAPISFVNNNNN